jgi:pyridoxine 5-phosphate synthase
MTTLLVNIDHVATLRNARGEAFPDPVAAAAACETGGADGIVFHLREDRRHITERDVRLLAQTVTGRLDFELAAIDDVISLCCEIRPDVATLVPERREELTTEGGLDVRAHASRLAGVIRQLSDAGIEDVSLFVDPVPAQVEEAARIGATCIELHTGDFANAATREQRSVECRRLSQAAETAHAAGLRVHAGHGLDYGNYAHFAGRVPYVEEVSIGFAIVARSIFVGLERAVRDMARLVHAGGVRP